MKSESDENAQPAGWPRWLWCIVTLLVAPEHRTELMRPDQRAKTSRALAEKLTKANKEWQEWRERALSAEKVVSYELPQALKQACERHDKQHSTTLSWRI